MITVSLHPDWRDPARRRWLLSRKDSQFAWEYVFPDEGAARLAAFVGTGVGDFLDGITWVRGTGFPSFEDVPEFNTLFPVPVDVPSTKVSVPLRPALATASVVVPLR